MESLKQSALTPSQFLLAKSGLSTKTDEVKRVAAPVNGFDVHLQAVPTRRSVAALLAHEGLLASMFGRFVHTQLRPC